MLHKSALLVRDFGVIRRLRGSQGDRGRSFCSLFAINMSDTER